MEIIDKVDRISALPDDVIYHILSFLDVLDAVNAGLLSKRWGLLCSTLPFIDIDIPRMSVKQRYKFEHFITWVLSSRTASNIIRLTLRCESFTEHVSCDQIFRWMCVAARRNVQEFIMVFHPSDVLCIPLSLVSGQSLQYFELDMLGQALRFPTSPGFSCLKTLYLKKIRLTDEDLTRSFFSGCPLLKKLVMSVYAFENMKVLDISSSSIEHLFFEESGGNEGYWLIDLKISCPKLLAFKYGATMLKKYIFEGVSSLETFHMHPYYNAIIDLTVVAACVYGVLKTANKIVELKLGMFIIEGLMGDKFRFDQCSFHRLKALNLYIAHKDDYMKFLSLLLKHCHNLEALTLYIEENDDEVTLSEMEDLNKYTCLRSSLKSIHLMNFGGEEDEIAFARTLLECGLVLKKFVLYWYHKEAIDDEVENRILSFPRSSESVKVVFGLSRDLTFWANMPVMLV